MSDVLSIDVSKCDIETLKNLRDKINAILDGPADGLSSLDNAVASMKALRERVAETGKAAVTQAINALFAAHPEIDSVRWTQYTPYFNDGDSCEFSVHEPRVRMVGATGDEGDYEDGYEDSWNLKRASEKEGREIPETLRKDLGTLDSLFSESEDAMKATFGDHVQVTVGRDGKAEIEEYSHD